jgi:hypothetical protein
MQHNPLKMQLQASYVSMILIAILRAATLDTKYIHRLKITLVTSYKSNQPCNQGACNEIDCLPFCRESIKVLHFQY